MATTTKAYAALSADTPLVPHTIERRAPTSEDVSIEIKVCSRIAHSVIRAGLLWAEEDRAPSQ